MEDGRSESDHKVDCKSRSVLHSTNLASNQSITLSQSQFRLTSFHLLFSFISRLLNPTVRIYYPGALRYLSLVHAVRERSAPLKECGLILLRSHFLDFRHATALKPRSTSMYHWVSARSCGRDCLRRCGQRQRSHLHRLDMRWLKRR